MVIIEVHKHKTRISMGGSLKKMVSLRIARSWHRGCLILVNMFLASKEQLL